MVPQRLLSAALAPALAAGALGWSAPALAANPPITSSRYAIDVFQGPVLAPVRVTGLAGAYAPIAEGVEGMAVNTAAPAVRSLYSSKPIDYDLSLSLTSPGSLQRTDFDNNGSVGFTYEKFVFSQLGGLIQDGPWGVGLLATFQSYTVKEEGGQKLEIVSGRLQAQLARAVLDGELVLGGGVRAVTLGVTKSSGDTSSSVASMVGFGLEAGAVWTPVAWPLRAALSVRAPVRGRLEAKGSPAPDARGDVVVEGRYLPDSIELPWEVEAGFAYQFGSRPLQMSWDHARAERYRALPREKLLLTASVLVSGPVERGVGFESFLAQRIEHSGKHTVWSPRLGVELEPLVQRLQLRAGSYLEPSRFAGISPRLHATAGSELRLFRWSVFGLVDPETSWRVSSFVDVSRLYVSWGISVGIWH